MRKFIQHGSGIYRDSHPAHMMNSYALLDKRSHLRHVPVILYVWASLYSYHHPCMQVLHQFRVHDLFDFTYIVFIYLYRHELVIT